MKKAVIFFLGVITGRYLITFCDKLVSTLLHGYYDGYTPYKNERICTKSYYRPTHYVPYRQTLDSELRSITFATRGDALDVLEKCREEIDQYGQCSVASFKTHADEVNKEIKSSVKYTDNNYGWKRLDYVPVSIHRFGFSKNYVLDFPKVEEL